MADNSTATGGAGGPASDRPPKSDPKSGPRSVTVWFERLRDGDPDAAAVLWDRYFDRLVRFARPLLAGRHRRVADEEDIAVQVMHALCTAADRGRLPSIDGRDDLWRMLLRWTRHEVVDHVRKETRLKRGGGTVRGDSVAEGGLDRFASPAPTAETVFELSERLTDLLGRLPDESLRRIARLRLGGDEVAEIAAALDLSPRTIDRKLALIRSLWSDHGSPSGGSPRASRGEPDAKSAGGA